MSRVYADRVQETSTTTGTGTYTLAGAVLGSQSFAAVGDGNTCYYCAIGVDGNGNPNADGWEVGLGTYTLAGTTLARTTVLASSNGGAAVNWPAGTRRIFVDLPATDVTGTGTGSLVRATSPTLVTPILGTPTSGTLTNCIGPSKSVAQMVSTMSSASTTGSTQIPADDTIPQITEGDEVMTCAITPTNASSTLLIQVIVMGASDTAGRIFASALFRDAGVDALAAIGPAVPGANSATMMSLNHTVAAGSTSATTFRVRIGLSGTGTYTFNGSGGTRRYGAITKSSIVITEFLP